MGSDVDLLLSPLYRSSFNSRSRMGSDVHVLAKITGHRSFNSRSRMGSDGRGH